MSTRPASQRTPERQRMFPSVDSIAVLKTVALFADVPEEALATLADLLEPVQAVAGTTIFTQGEPGDTLYIMVQGRVRLHSGDYILSYPGAGDIFGEMALLDPEPREESATAEDDCALYALSWEPFYSLVRNQHTIARLVLERLTHHRHKQLELEKMLVLKSVTVFAETPDEVLREVVPLLESLDVAPDEVVFHKGDPGASMYLIARGRVRVHDGEMTLNYLHKGAVFGEMAALDPEPRSASVTAVEPTRLYRLNQMDFYTLMEKRIEIVQGVVHVLCQHLRARMRDLAEDFTYMQQFARVTAAAAALEAGVYDMSGLDEVGQRTDELGQLARVFQRTTREVYAREQRLKREVVELRIEVDTMKKEQHVNEITQTDYFRQLQRKVRDLRGNLEE